MSTTAEAEPPVTSTLVTLIVGSVTLVKNVFIAWSQLSPAAVSRPTSAGRQYLPAQRRRVAAGDRVRELLQLGLDLVAGAGAAARQCIGSA